MKAKYNVLIITKAQDFLRLKSNYHRLVKNMPSRQLIFVGNEEVCELAESLNLGERVGFIHEDSIIPFADVHAVMQDVLGTKDVPRGVTGWYYQQFLKMQYSYVCKDDYYLVWDGDTIPCKPFTMFAEDGVTPFFDLKREYHEEYFTTLGKLFPGMGKVIESSFISEHMLMNCEIMQNLIREIMQNSWLTGKTFYERIIRCIEPEKLTSNSFSEFETYGTYTCLKYFNAYRLRNWHSFRYAGHFFHPDKITDSDYEWLSRDFDAISFEKGNYVREDHKNLFDNKEYQAKLSARQMLEIAQEEFREGYLEVWEDDEADAEVQDATLQQAGLNEAGLPDSKNWTALEFPENYFDKEVQAGFAVGEVMKRVWASTLEVLQKVIDVCEKHEIQYFLFFGSMLGAVRHQGFIPWDDDLDIAMTGENYVRFLSVAVQELPEDYGVLNVYTEKNFSNYFTRITNGRTLELDGVRMEEYHNCPFASGIDVFPLYYVPRDEQCKEQQRMLLTVIGQLCSLLDYKKQKEEEGTDIAVIQRYNEDIAKNLVDLEKVTGFRFGGEKSLNTQLTMLYDQICRLYGEEESDYVTAFPHYMENEEYLYNKEWVQETVIMPFENMMVRVPKGYDEALTRNFGDYMKPVRMRGGHDYIYFRGQIQTLLDKLKTDKVTAASLIESKDAALQLPKEWKDKIFFKDEPGDEKRKKIILYSYTWEEIFCNSGYAMDKLRYVLQTFKQNKDVLLWWFDTSLTSEARDVFGKVTPEMFGEYCEIVKEYQEEDWGIYDDSGDAARAIAMSDAYYGDDGQLSTLFKNTGKIIMYQDYEII